MATRKKDTPAEETPETVEAPKRGRKPSTLGATAARFERLKKAVEVQEERTAKTLSRWEIETAKLGALRSGLEDAKAELEKALAEA